MYKKVRRNLCDTDTGERIEEPLYRREVKRVELKDVKFMKLSIAGTQKMLKELTPTEIVMVIGLAQFVSYEDCCIRIGGRGEVMSAQDIAKALEMDDAKVYRLIKSLEKKGVMGHHITGSILEGYEGKAKKVYTVNPFIYCKGRRVNKAVYDFYRKSGWRNGV